MANAQAPDALLVWVATWGACLIGGYLLVVAIALVVAHLISTDGPAVRVLEAMTPAVVRRAVNALLGIGVSASLVVATPAASEAATGSPGPAPSPSAIPSSLAWPVASPAEHPPPPTASAFVVVHSGDTLWGIAARHVRQPSAARVARAWPRWWAANRAVIGPDPDLIHPGERLRSPVTTSRRLP